MGSKGDCEADRERQLVKTSKHIKRRMALRSESAILRYGLAVLPGDIHLLGWPDGWMDGWMAGRQFAIHTSAEHSWLANGSRDT